MVSAIFFLFDIVSSGKRFTEYWGELLGNRPVHPSKIITIFFLILVLKGNLLDFNEIVWALILEPVRPYADVPFKNILNQVERYYYCTTIVKIKSKHFVKGIKGH